MKYSLSHIEELEAEAIFIIRESVAQFQNPAILFSGGKDSIVLTHLAKKAFWPSALPLPLVHIDTGHNFEETIDFRDEFVSKMGAKLIVGSVQNSIDSETVVEEQGINATRNALQSTTILETIETHKFDACLGGARRDEEKARAKERFFSHRDNFGQWNPKNQRPELWNLFNGLKNQGEHFRIFPLSNWTELDIWQYIQSKNIEVPSLYYSHSRKCFRRNGTILSVNQYQSVKETEKVEDLQIRFRTMGDITITGAVESKATSVEEIINEITASRITERGGRADDHRSDTAMEDRKKQGYF